MISKIEIKTYSDDMFNPDGQGFIDVQLSITNFIQKLQERLEREFPGIDCDIQDCPNTSGVGSGIRHIEIVEDGFGAEEKAKEAVELIMQEIYEDESIWVDAA